MENKSGFWSGMPRPLRIRAVCFALYYLIAGLVFTQSPVLGIIVFVLPGFWYLLKNWIIAEFFGVTDLERADTLTGYTVSYIFNRASNLTRAIVGIAVLLLVAFGLGWTSTEDLRLKAAEPTLTERVTDAAGSAVEATKETTGGWAASAKEKTGGWVSAAKGWFGDDSEDETAQ